MYDYRLAVAKMSLDHPWMRRPNNSHPRRAEDPAPPPRQVTRGRERR
jgi:hypothetical protein